MKNNKRNIKENKNFLLNMFSLSHHMNAIKGNFTKNKKTIFFLFLLSIFLIFLDQATKQIAFSALIKIPSNQIEVFSFFNFTLVINEGVSFGMLSKIPFAREILSLVVILIILLLVFLFLKEEKFELGLAYILIISGAIGNTIDRITIGGVIDFLDFHINSAHYPAFNIADSVIFIGAIIMIFPDFTKKIISKFKK